MILKLYFHQGMPQFFFFLIFFSAFRILYRPTPVMMMHIKVSPLTTQKVLARQYYMAENQL